MAPQWEYMRKEGVSLIEKRQLYSSSLYYEENKNALEEGNSFPFCWKRIDRFKSEFILLSPKFGPVLIDRKLLVGNQIVAR